MSHQEKVILANKAWMNPETAPKNDRFRLRYHLMPPVGWMNDPNGLIQFNSDYHVFYQHYPFEPKQGPMHWGHAKSADLVNWEHLPVALAPSEPYDLDESGSAGGCWSGSAVEDNGDLVLIYTAHVDGNHPEEVQCLAVSKDGIIFEKEAVNPVIDGPPHEKVFGFRDPKVWKWGDMWNMVVGSGKDGKGRALLYQSDDLRQWRYIGVAAESDGTWGDMWECPDLFPLGAGERYALIISPMNMVDTKTMYITGKFNYESGRLECEYNERLDYGFDFYAPQTLVDEQGRRILIAWMNIWGSSMPERADNWLGAMTIPRELKLAQGGTLRMLPVSELAQLRGNHHCIPKCYIDVDIDKQISLIRGDSLEIIAVYDLNESDAESFGIQLRVSSDGSQYSEIGYRSTDRTLYVDRTSSGVGDGGISEVLLKPMEDGKLKLHLFLDRSSIELFANDGMKTMTNRIYPDPDSQGIKLFSLNGEATLDSLDVWELRPI